ncbi:MAG: 6,7-dimethyl-8-ribityllumazine synthase [Nitrospirales bacterium]|nr:6,7-dimethyl-8-ribityllumazine synthase [Nitrospira sp.]MDR4502789.1 6,7-dimethyl-8-ribityllumazine synthase [Nitrospirales bacterium]
MEPVEGGMTAQDLHFGLVVSKFNEFVTSRLLTGALDILQQHGTREEHIQIVRVPGAFEIPLIARQLAASQQFSAIICLGAVIRGDTPHFDYICTETARGISQATLETNTPIIFGVLTTNTVDQALERSGALERNRGADAARTAIEMANLMKHPLLQANVPPSPSRVSTPEEIDPLECW